MLTDAALDDSPYKIAVNATRLVDQDHDHEVGFFLWRCPNACFVCRGCEGWDCGFKLVITSFRFKALGSALGACLRNLRGVLVHRSVESWLVLLCLLLCSTLLLGLYKST